MASYPRPARAARQELRELDGAALHRLFVAFHNMQQTDDWAKLAGMHGGGLPDSEDVKIARNRVYCHHRSETFPPWHRAYLAEFEYVLQNHDPWYPGDHMTANRIMLPFWDWSGTRFAEGYPEFVTWPSVRLYLDGEWKTVTNPLASGPHFQRRRTRRRRTTPDSIARELQFRAVRSEATDAINTDDHFSMSARNFSATSLEEPHDDVHVAVGGDMSGVDTAAFDPIFWLHHCNVERIYYAWQTHYPNEKPTNPQEEMGPFAPKAQFGKLMGWQNDTGKYTTVEEWFDLANLDYTFSYLLPSPTPRSSQMRVPRKYVVLRDVETPPESVSFYVYIQRKSDVKSAEGAEKAKVDFPQISSVIASPQIDEPDCVGVISVFSLDTYHADIECKKCEERDPFSYSLDVTSALQELGVKNSDEVIVTIQAKNSEDEDMQNMVIPEPVILHENDFFSLSDIDSDNLDKARKQDVASLKRVLAFYGYLKADVPLSQAIKDFQQKWGLKVDGVVGPNTKSLLHRPRSADPDDLANPILEIINKLKTGQRKFRYAIGRVDQDLIDINDKDKSIEDLNEVVEKCFLSWSSAISEGIPGAVKFVRTIDVATADVVVTWLALDGPGFTLGHVKSKSNGQVQITLDEQERWTLHGTGFHVGPVLAHEIGHIFNLSHSSTTKSAMYPYYRPNFAGPTAIDIDNIVKQIV